MHAFLFFTFEGNTGTGDLCQAVDVVGFDTEAFFNIAAHLLRPGLCAEDAGFELVVLRLVSPLRQGLADEGGIGGGAAEDGGIEVHHELDLAVSVAGGHGKGETADLMGAAVQAGAASEQTVTVADLAHILICTAGGYDRPCAALLPHIDVLLCIEGDDTFSGGAGGGMDADTVFEVGSHKSVGVSLTQVVLGQERKLSDVVNTPDVFRTDSLFVHQIAVVGHVVIDIFDLFDDFFILDRDDLLT